MLASPPSELPPRMLVEGVEGCGKHPHQKWEGPCSTWGGLWEEWQGVNQSREGWSFHPLQSWPLG